MTLALWLLIYMGISYGIGKLFEATLGWRSVMYAFYPAMLIASLGRLLATVLSGQKVGDVDVLRSSGPSQGSSDGLPGGWWFRTLYAVLPFVCCVGAFVICWHYLDEPLDFGERLPGLGLDSSVFDRSFSTLGAFLSEILATFGKQRLGHWQMWAFLYVGFGLVVASAPNKNDLISVGAGCAIVGGVVLLLGKAGVKVFAGGLYGGPFWSGFSFMVAMSLFVVLTTLVVLLPIKYIRTPKDR